MSSKDVTTTGEVTLKKEAVKSLWWTAGYGASLMSPAMCLGGIMAFQASVSGHCMALPVLIGTGFVFLWAVSYYRMAVKMPKCGSHYAYVFSEFGVWPAWLVWACVACVYVTPIPPLMILYLYTGELWPWLPYWAVILIMEAFVTFISIRGIRLASGTSFGLYVTETVIILALCGVLLHSFMGTVPDLGTKLAAAFNPSFTGLGVTQAIGLSGVMMAALFVTWNFLGFASITTIVEESKPRLIGLGVLLSVTMVGLVYLIATTIIPILWWDNIGGLAASPDPLVDAAVIGFGRFWPFILFAITLSITTCLVACQNAGPRIFVDMARDKVLPKVFGTIHRKYQTPWLMLIVVGAVTGFGAWIQARIFGLWDGLLVWVSMQAVLFLIAYIVVSVANIKAFWKDYSLAGWFLSKIFPVAGIIVAGYLIVTSGKTTLIWSGAFIGFWLIIGAVLYVRRGKEMRQLRLDELA